MDHQPNHRPPISVPPAHPYADPVSVANRELHVAADAIVVGNDGLARVCARRAVGGFLQGIARITGVDYGGNALANLRFVRDDAALPAGVRDAAERLLGGARSILAGDVYSSDPIGDARLIVEHFLDAPAPR